MIITSFYIVIIGKKIVDGSCNSENFSYACIYFVLSTWILGVTISIMTIFCDLCEKIKGLIKKWGQIENLNEITQIRIITNQKSERVN